MKSTVVLLPKSETLALPQLTTLFFKCRGTASASRVGNETIFIETRKSAFPRESFARGDVLKGSFSSVGWYGI